MTDSGCISREAGDEEADVSGMVRVAAGECVAMTCYVDDVEHRFSRMKMCHLWADTEEELLAMADTIGVQRKWIQGHPTLSFGKHRNASWVHFDIAKSKKALAIRAGAVLTDVYGPLVHTTKQRMAAHPDDGQVQRDCQRLLDKIERIRAGRTDPPRADPDADPS